MSFCRLSFMNMNSCERNFELKIKGNMVMCREIVVWVITVISMITSGIPLRWASVNVSCLIVDVDFERPFGLLVLSGLHTFTAEL